MLLAKPDCNFNFNRRILPWQKLQIHNVDLAVPDAVQVDPADAVVIVVAVLVDAVAAALARLNKAVN